MKKKTAIIVGSLVLGGLIAVFSNMKSLLHQIGLPRGLANNNPGNIRLSNDKWIGSVARDKNTDQAFVQFENLAYGIRAMITNILNLAIIYKYTTVSQLINKYAPPNENNTGSYISFVVKAVGKQELPASNDEIVKMIYAMIIIENGVVASNYVNKSDISEGLKLVNSSVLKTYFNHIKSA